MARSVRAIYDQIILVKNGQSDINGLLPNNESFQRLSEDVKAKVPVARWRLLYYVVAVVIHIFELLADLLKQDIIEINAKSKPATARWYQSQVLNFQLGYTLVYQDDLYQYPVVDEAAKIIKLCAVQERTTGGVIIKVAKLSSNGPTPLDPSELAAVQGYVKQIRIPGPPIQILSEVADLLKVNATVYYNAITPLSDVKQMVENAIKTYLVNLPFNGQFVVNGLIDAVQNVGVSDFTIQSIETKYGLLAYTPVNRVFTPQSGYCKIDNIFPLSATINYQVV